MTDETWERIVAFVKKNVPPDPRGRLGRLARIPVYVSDEVADNEPELSDGEYALGIRLSPNDHADLLRRASRGWRSPNPAPQKEAA